jgi:hypothetical protein
MPTRPQIELTKEELERAEIPTNHILVKMLHTAEGIKSKGGVILGFNTDVVYSEGDDSHSANLSEVYGEVYKVPHKLFFDPKSPQSMDIDTEMALQVGDVVWFGVLESKNSTQLLCEGVLYKSIPYADCYVARRYVRENSIPELWTICLNGYILLQPVNFAQISPLDAISDTQVDKSRGIVRFIGKAPLKYLNDSYTHIEDLRVGDEVLFDKKSSPFYLERTKSLAVFDGDNQYLVVPRRKIVAVLKRDN